MKLLLVLGLGLVASTAHAATGMPWEGPIEQVLNSLTGPIVRWAMIGAIAIIGISMAFSQNQGFMRAGVAAIFGLSIAAAAGTWGPDLFGFTGSGALIP